MTIDYDNKVNEIMKDKTKTIKCNVPKKDK